MARMKPLQSVAMGLVIIVLVAPVGGYDLLADPVGWLLVLLGLRTLAPDSPYHPHLLALAALATVAATVVWFPGTVEALYDRDPADGAALGWAVNLPQLLFTALLTHVLAGRAAAAVDVKAARWLATARTGVIVVGLLPVLVFGGGMSSLESFSYLAAGIVAVLLITLLFTYSGRPWAGVGNNATPEPSPT